jgi:hypothetical protein
MKNQGFVSAALAITCVAIMLIATTSWEVFFVIVACSGFAAGAMRYIRRIGITGTLALLTAPAMGRLIGGTIHLSTWPANLRYAVLGIDMILGTLLFVCGFSIGNRWIARRPEIRHR